MPKIFPHCPVAVGTLLLTSTLTHLGAASVKLSVTARDGEGVNAARPAEVTINVLRSAQAPAVFKRSRYTFTVPEDAPPGTPVGTVEAVNPAGGRADVATSSLSCLRASDVIHLNSILLFCDGKKLKMNYSFI